MLRAILSQPGVVATLILAPLLAALVVMAQIQQRRLRWWLAISSLFLVLGLTLYPLGLRVGAISGAMRECVQWLLSPGIMGMNAEVLLNVAMFVFLAAAWTIASGRIWVTLISALALSAMVELAQPLVGHTCSGQDWTANAIGAALGTAGGALLYSALERPTNHHVSR